MEADKLVAMANQIATFFRSYPETDAMRGIHDHIVAFWTPGMRRTLEARLQDNPAGVESLVVGAITTRPRGESPIKKETEGPAAGGQLASDAG
jgi:formate dehydrogenase subunit delta